MRLLVTGRSGQLAHCLIESAAQRSGLQLAAIGRPELDLAQPLGIEAAIAAAEPDIVINTAAYTAVELAEDEPDRAFAINSAGAEAVARAAKAAGAGLIQLSTDYVFDGELGRPYDEDDEPRPLNVYGASKREGEEKCLAVGGRAVVVRTSWIYSSHGGNFVRTMLRLAGERETVQVVDDQRGNPTSAHDLADALLDLAARMHDDPTACGGSLYHLAGTGSASWAQLASELFDQARAIGLPAARVEPIATHMRPSRAVRPRNSQLDCGRIGRDYGLALPDWQSSLSTVLARIARSR